MISALFIARPRLAIVIAIVITIAGVIALMRIPVAQFPDIVPPRVQVSANYPGASAAVVEASVAQPLEAQIVGVDRMIYMKSTSANDGTYSLTVSFQLGSDPDVDTVNVNNRVQTALAQLPAEVQSEGLTVAKRSAAILQFIAFYSDGGKLSPTFITSYATINVLDALSRVPGVGQALLFGKLNYSMRIWFDTERLTSLNLAPSDILAAIQAQNVQAPAGRIGARPISNDQQLQMNVETQGRLTTPEQFGNIVLRANPDGSVLRVRDVARVEMGAQNDDVETRINGAPGVGVAIYLSPQANAVDTSRLVTATLDRLEHNFPAGMKGTIVYDSTVFVNDTIHEVLRTLAQAFVLVVIVVFFFLGNLRATVIPAVAVPVSLIGTFAVLLAMGYSANTVSLLAMVLAIGIVVDDAIVVVENVERVLEEEPHLTPTEATLKAMRQITAPIIAISLVLLSVFVPVAFIPGISGELFRQFAVTISVAMVISAVNALTLSPALCAIVLRPGSHKRGPMRHVLGGIGRVRDGYAWVVQRLVRVSALSLVLVLIVAAAAGGMARITPTSFLPEEDQGAFFINIQLPDGASVARTSAATRQVEAIVHHMPQVDGAFSVIGFSILDSSSEPNAAFVVAKLKPFADRTRAADSAQALIGRIFGAAQQNPHRQRHRLQSAADHRAFHQRRLRISARSDRGSGPGEPRQRHRGDRRRGEPGSAPGAGILDLHRDQPVDLSRHRSGQGAGPGPQHGRRLRRAAGDAGRRLRQQFQPLRPHLAGQYRGRGEGSRRYRRHHENPRAQPRGRDGADELDCGAAHHHRAAGHHALQQLPLGDDQWRPGPGCVDRHGARCHGRSLGADAAAGLRL